MSQEHEIRRAPDYTGPFLVTAGVIVFLLLCVVWAIWGLFSAVLAGWATDKVIGIWRRA